MKEKLQSLVSEAVASLGLSAPAIRIDRTKDATHGDFATNVALMCAKQAGKPPRQLAEALVAALPANDAIEKVEIAGPGFINFFVSAASNYAIVDTVLRQAERFGCNELGAAQKVQLEFVSANPTGPLHVGHGRGAAYGASLANVLKACGYQVHSEYYVNDAGRQMNILAASVWLRYLGLCGEELPFPVNGYQGDYIIDIAKQVRADHGDALRKPAAELLADLPADETDGGDKELYIDAVIERAKALLGDGYQLAFGAALDSILGDIRDDLAEFGVVYDEWFSELSLMDKVADSIETLKASGHMYQKNGAWWFKSEALGDEKDRVVVRDNGQTTYFASDIAYHHNKIQRGFDRIVDVWGSDHHGYVPRVKAAMTALGEEPEKLDVRLVQFAVLYRGSEKVPMSTRSGQFVTLRDLRNEVGNDAARFFYVMRSADQHLDFDLELAKSQSNDNPVYYIQYAHARVNSVLAKAADKESAYDQQRGLANLAKLSEEHELALMKKLAAYPDTVAGAARTCGPQLIAHYLRELAADFHSYYNAHAFVIEDADLRNARLALCVATQQAIRNGLALLGVTAPESM